MTAPDPLHALCRAGSVSPSWETISAPGRAEGAQPAEMAATAGHSLACPKTPFPSSLLPVAFPRPMTPRHKRRRPKSDERVELCKEGLRIGGEVVPLHAGSVHYWRLEPSAWRPALDAMKSLGFRVVDTYVPWAIHETAPGTFDFGREDPRRDVGAFITLARDLGLFVIARPGPHINAELTGFGIPERVLWDAACQARSPHGKPVILPVPPLAFPVPSYASETFHSEVARWFAAVGAELVGLVYPLGPIVMVQVDNEGALYFRDGVYDQDYHPDAIEKYRRFVHKRVEKTSRLRERYGDPEASFASLEPPKLFDAKTADELARHLDWAEFQEEMLADAFRLMKKHLEVAGLGSVPTSHNLPLSEGATPLDPERLGRVVDLLGLDYYHGASSPQRSEIARRTSELAERSRARGHPPFACELGAGFPPFFPPLRERDNLFAALTALAYGLRGFNVYMAVERDRWIGSPIDASGRIRREAETWRRLIAALERTRFFALRRETLVHIVVPRSYRRLARVCHAFGPLSAAFFHVLGGGAHEAAFEDDFGLGGPVVIETERFVRQLEHALGRERIPYALAGGDLFRHSLATARWLVLACSGGLEPELVEALEHAWRRGAAISVGPRLPERDDAFRPLGRALELPEGSAVPPRIELGADAVEAAVRAAREHLRLGSAALEPDDVFSTLHVDERGTPRVAFVINPGKWARECTLDARGIAAAVDALDGQRFETRHGRLALGVPGWSVRMLELELD
jgi:beta-galactosidase